MVTFSRNDADFFVPDGTPPDQALARTTHLGIGAHQDDLEIFSFSGIAECYEAGGGTYTGVVVTDGAGSPKTGGARGRSPEDMVADRRMEQRRAAEIGRYSCVIQLGHPSATVKDPDRLEVVDDLAAILRTARPRVLYLHNPADKHDTHVAVLLRSLSALRSLPQAERPERVYGCEVWRGLDWLADEDKQPLDAGIHPELAAPLLQVFVSQIGAGKRYDLAALGRRQANATFFEPRASDPSGALVFAMDLTPLVRDDTLSIETLTRHHLEKFQQDVLTRLARFS
ncbi:MAG: PIG-L family deacetylase [Candidatus Methylacidiphilales bacterium]|nr:PIG-L family deacetylase [Candidatus Methylacidiphilales bacterium]